MKKIKLIEKIEVALLVLLSSAAAISCKDSKAKDNRPVIKIAFAQDEGIISYVDENDNLAGEEVEVWKEIAKRIPEYNIQFIPTSQDDLRVGLQTGNYDGSVGDFFLNRERLASFTIPLEPLDFTWTGMLIRKEYADGVKSLADIARKQADGLTIAPQYSSSGATYILEIYNEKNPDNKLNFESTSEHVWTVAMSYVGVGRYGATCAQKTDFENLFQAEDGAYHEYLDYVTWIPTENVGAYTLFNKNTSQDFLDKYVAALKSVKDEGIASEISKRIYGYDAYSGEYYDFTD